MPFESMMRSNHFILCDSLLLPSIFPRIKIFFNESALCIRWPKYWSFSFSISPSNEHPGLITFGMDWLDLLQSKELLRVFSNTTVQKHPFFRSIYVKSLVGGKEPWLKVHWGSHPLGGSGTGKANACWRKCEFSVALVMVSVELN